MERQNLGLCGPGWSPRCISCYLCDPGQITSSLILHFSFIKWQGAGGHREQGGSCIISKHGVKGRAWVLDLEDLILIPALDKCDLGHAAHREAHFHL